jgi:small-conductance mechanosensitive channel
VVVLASALLVFSATRSRPILRGTVLDALLLGLIAATGWLAVRLARVAENAAMRRFNVEVPDNFRARRLSTQIRVLRRVVTVAITLVVLATMLLTFPEGRAIGASLLAGAGLFGVIAGVAARSTVGNLIAGLQIAFAEPIRLGDVVVVEGEWGHVEEITLTYVIVRLWDRRRLVLPSNWFVEHPVQNWTRYSADILGTVYLYVDYSTSVDGVRAELERIVKASPLWDGSVALLQVVDATERTMVLRALVSAHTAPNSWDLRCEIRERLLVWLRREQPQALPRLRAEVDAQGDGGSSPHQRNTAASNRLSLS